MLQPQPKRKWVSFVAISSTFIFTIFQFVFFYATDFFGVVNVSTITVDNPSDIHTTISEYQVNKACSETDEIVRQVYYQAMQNESQQKLWSQKLPPIYLNCKQLTQSIQAKSQHGTEMSPTLSLLRLTRKLQKMKSEALKVVAIGGSMTTGFVDVGKTNFRELAWPTKLFHFLQHKWPNSSLEVVNLAIGGANEATWLGNLDIILEEAPDIILVESAVNDQCDYDKQQSAADAVNTTSNSLLNVLMNFPTEPSVLSVELFRTAYTNNRDANMHCRDHVKEVLDDSLDQTCLYCEQWWMPQDWRTWARNHNSVSYISYRDAVWPDLDNPPEQLCQYWSGLSHPQAGVHAMVASTVLFQFILTDMIKDSLQQSMHGLEKRVKIDAPSTDLDICLNPVSSYHAVQGDPKDPMMLVPNNNSSCWRFFADSKEKYGWICEVDTKPSHRDRTAMFYHLQKNINVGELKRVIISRLVSYDERMADAQIWFSAPNLTNSANVFVGDPAWNVTSSHAEKTSIPRPYSIRLADFKFKEPWGLHWKQGVNLELTFNLRLLPGTSESSRKHKMDLLGVDKFKLLGIVSC